MARTGDKNPRWIEDRTKLKKADDRRTTAYMDWVKSVKNRDNWTCRLKSNECTNNLEAHHIFNWTDYPDLRYEINNGITLCKFHHPLKWEEEKKMIPLFQELILMDKYNLTKPMNTDENSEAVEADIDLTPVDPQDANVCEGCE